MSPEELATRRAALSWDGDPMRYKEACALILAATSEGQDLVHTDRKLVAWASTVDPEEGLPENKEAAFANLYERVRSGYVKPWFHGIEPLTIDHEGFVYWKDRRVEHYDRPWAFTTEAKEEAVELARRCRIVEQRGGSPSIGSVVWGWRE